MCTLTAGAASSAPHMQSAGLSESLAEAFDVVLPDELFDKVLEEALVFERHERDERAGAAH